MEIQQPNGSITTVFTLSGRSFDVNRFTELAGIQPTKIWHQKLELLKNNPDFSQIPQVEWRYELRKHPHWSVDDAIREILVLFEPRRKQIVSFAAEHSCIMYLSCRIYGDSNVIIYKVERGTIERLAAFGAEFSFTVEPNLTSSVNP